MSQKNQYVRNAKISKSEFKLLIELFAVDLNASQITTITGLNRNTVNRYLRLIREAIARYSMIEFKAREEIKFDEIFFIDKFKNNFRARRRVIIGTFKRNGTIHTIIDPNISPTTLYAIISGKVAINSQYIDEIKGFLNYVKNRLIKFRGISKTTFYLHFKECEFRYNHQGQDLCKILLKLLKEKPQSL